MPAKFSAQKLRLVRKQKKISQMFLAELCDSSDRYIRDLELGRKANPSATIVCMLSRALDVPMDELMEYKQEDQEE